MAEAWQWSPSALGGGGYITGILQNEKDPNVLYARCDVGGVFQSLDRGKTWKTRNGGLTDIHHHSVQSFAIHPAQPSRILRGSGEARGHRLYGSIHKSVDGGERWYEVCKGADFYGNGPTRMFGEVIAFEPEHGKVVLAGAYSTGMWRSEDEGETWTCVGLQGERFGFVVFHPLRAGVAYAGTIADDSIEGAPTGGLELETFLTSMHDFPRRALARLYMTEDNGNTWRLLWEGTSFAQLAFDRHEPERLYAACITQGVKRSVDGGRTWQPANEGLPSELRFPTIAADPHRPGTLYAAADVRPMHESPPIPLYRSEDYGKHWTLIKEHTERDLRHYPTYAGLRNAGWAISKIMVDATLASRLYLTNWYGVAVSEDGGFTWDANHYSGTETVCAEHVRVDPIRPQRVYVTMADHPPAVSDDGGRTFQTWSPKLGCNASTALVSSRHRSGWTLFGAVNRGKKKSLLARTRDDGASFETVLDLPTGLFVQGLAEDAGTPGIFYAFIDGEVEEGAGIHRSVDWGDTWERMPLPPAFTEAMTLPVRKAWIEEELLSVVVYQVKNACGCNQLLDAHPSRPGTLLWGEWTTGLFLTEDGGRNWREVGKPLPFGRHSASTISVVKYDPVKAGIIYAGFLREGLWRSEDDGKTWDKVFPADGTPFNATTLAIEGESLYIASEPLYWSPSPSSVWHSGDTGETWTEITDPEHGAVRWKGIAAAEGTVVGVACGNGIYRAERGGNP